MKWVVQGANHAHEVEVVRVVGGFDVVVDGQHRRVDLVCLNGSEASLRFIDSNRSFYVAFQRGSQRRWRVAVRERELDLAVQTVLEAQVGEATAGSHGPSHLEAPIPGKVVAVKVAAGDTVEPGQALVVLEAMKMENELSASGAGTVAKVLVQPGDTVGTGELLIELE